MKNRVEVVIAGNRFTMTGEQDEEYMTKIAALVDNRVCKIKESGASTLQAVLLTACDIADNYVQAVKGSENLRTQISKYLDENKNLSRDLADAQEEIRSLEQAAEEKDKEMTEVNQYKARIAELEQSVHSLQQEAAQKDACQARVEELERALHETKQQAAAANTDVETHSRRATQLAAKLDETQKQMQQANAAAETSGKRVSELESQLRAALQQVEDSNSGAEKNSRRVSELEQKLSETQQRMQSASEDAESHSRRIHELELQLVEADARHTNDLEQAERVGQELIALREKNADSEKTQQRVDELEKELNSTQRQLSDASARLARLFK